MKYILLMVLSFSALADNEIKPAINVDTGEMEYIVDEPTEDTVLLINEEGDVTYSIKVEETADEVWLMNPDSGELQIYLKD